jgi:hypothetical protein
MIAVLDTTVPSIVAVEAITFEVKILIVKAIAVTRYFIVNSYSYLNFDS